MAAYIVRRLFLTLIMLLVVSYITYALPFIGPTDPVIAMAGPRAQGASLEALRKELGLDRPVPVQYFDYMRNVLRGDLGTSYYFRRPVTEALFSRLPATAELAACVMGLSLVFGLPMGILAALKKGKLVDNLLTASGFVLISMPTFFIGLLLLYVFAFRLQLFPIGGHGTWKHLVLPGLSVSLPWSIWYGTILRSNLLEVMSADYVRTAYAKGLRGRLVVWRHMLRNALLPLVTMLGMDLATLLTGTALVEYVFNWPGVGWQALQAALHRDVPMIMGSVLFGAALIGLANIGVDVLYTVLDPRVRVE